MHLPPPTKSIEVCSPDLADPELRMRLMTHALVRLRDEAAAEDAVQETLKRAATKWDTFDPAFRPLACWVFGILNLVLREMYRDRRRQPHQASSIPHDWDQLPAREAFSMDLEVLVSLLAKLPDPSRLIVTTYHLEELSHEQIAKKLGITPGNSRIRLARAMAELRQMAAREGSR